MAVIENYSEYNFRYIDNFLKNKGLNANARAGLIGNLYVESKLYPNNLQNSYEGKHPYYWTDDKYTQAVDNGTYKDYKIDRHGYSIAQWTSEGRKAGHYDYCKSHGKSIGDLQMACEWLWIELTTVSRFKKYVLPVLQEGKSVDECARIVMLKFEAPANKTEENQQKRVAIAMCFYNKYYAPTVGKDEEKVEPVTSDGIIENGISYITYKIVGGDTLYGIARKFNTTVDVLKALNPTTVGKTPNLISPGQIIKVGLKSNSSNDEVTPSVISTNFKIDTATHYNKTYSKSYKTTCDLNLRTGAGVTKNKIITLNMSTQVRCYGYYSIYLGIKWFLVQVTLNGIKYKGFCSSKYLK